VSWAILGLSMYAGAFNVEIFRSGIESVPKATIEAAESFGFSRLQAYRYIVLPLAFRVCLPALNNNLVNLVKTTSISYAIAVPEMLYVSAQIWSDSVNVKEMMNVLLICYVGLVGLFRVRNASLGTSDARPGIRRMSLLGRTSSWRRPWRCNTDLRC
jgi:polar amino acid transport system permease protein